MSTAIAEWTVGSDWWQWVWKSPNSRSLGTLSAELFLSLVLCDETRLTTKHLLRQRLPKTSPNSADSTKAVDFCIFDISLWNPNVALEIGLAKKRKEGTYFGSTTIFC